MMPGSSLRVIRGERRGHYVIGGYVGGPMKLRDGRYLRVYLGLSIQGTSTGPRLRVINSGYQYQSDQDGDKWIFRYDYERKPHRPYPPTHFHVKGKLTEDCLPSNKSLEEVHFPATRVSLEAVIRLLIEQFGISPFARRAVWRRVLTESEREFLNIAHRGASGPAR
jgi:hypothetical protein